MQQIKPICAAASVEEKSNKRRNSQRTEKENRNNIDMDSVIPYSNLVCDFNVKFKATCVNAVLTLDNVNNTAKTIENTPPDLPRE